MGLELGAAVHSVIVPDGISMHRVKKHFDPDHKNNFNCDNVHKGRGMVEYVQVPMDHFDPDSLHVVPIGNTGASSVEGDLLTDADMTPEEEFEMLSNIATPNEAMDEGEDAADGGSDEGFEGALDAALDDLRAGITDYYTGGDESAMDQALQDFLEWLDVAITPPPHKKPAPPGKAKSWLRM